MNAATSVTLSFPETDIALVTFNDQSRGANILSQSVLDELAGHLATIGQRKDLAGVVLCSGKPGVFIAGADIREFVAAGRLTKSDIVAKATRGRELFQQLAKFPFPSVAAINGICVGGGAELTVWCDRRLMASDPKTQIGFPEVKLGLIPGWGGTVRTPRIIGLSNAMELVTGGESISGLAAFRMGLVTDTIAEELLMASAIALIRDENKSSDYLRDRQRWSQPIAMSKMEMVFLRATAEAQIQMQTKGHYPAPLAALRLMLDSASLTEAEACQRETEAFMELFGSPVSRALINVFLLTDRNKKDPGFDGELAVSQPIRHVGIIGAGIMGSGIAGACLKRELTVYITDFRQESLSKGVRGAVEEASYDKVTRGTSPERVMALAPLIRAVHAEADFSGCDLVIEAIVENASVKQELHTRLESKLSESAILASNTSAISIGQLAEGLKRPDRFCGIHFFNPVRRMALVEVIRGHHTSNNTVATAVAFAKALGKNPIVVADGPGFLVNRLLFPYMNETLELLTAGLSIKEIEGAAKGFGMPMGPITLYDVVGLDTALFAGQVMVEAFPDRFLTSPLLDGMVKAGRLGQKSRSGFFAYRDKSDRGEADPSFDSFLEPYRGPAKKLAPDAVISRLFLPMLLEATRVLEEKKVRDPRDVDLGLIFGIGFPAFKGGLFFWADTIGIQTIVEMLKPLESLGERYRPTPLLLELAAKGCGFYDLVKHS